MRIRMGGGIVLCMRDGVRLGRRCMCRMRDGVGMWRGIGLGANR